MKTIVLAGGGTGGHIMPLIAIARAVKKLSPNVRIVVITEKGNTHIDKLTTMGLIDVVETVHAGKYRRYSNLTFWQKIVKVKTLLLNIRDIFLFLLGYIESIRILRRYAPGIVCFSGGYVALPVGYAARLLSVPYATNDLDAVPGLTNRMLALKAMYNFVALDPSLYTYQKDKMIHAGVPVDEARLQNHATRDTLRKELREQGIAKVLLVTGGSSGAVALDKMAFAATKELLEAYPDLLIVHQTGKGSDDLYSRAETGSHAKRIHAQRYFDNLLDWSAVADVVVSRAGASAITEFGLQEKALVLVPSPYLAGAHQVKNAQILSEKVAAIYVPEGDVATLIEQVHRLLDDPKTRQKLGVTLRGAVQSGAANTIAKTLIDVIV